MFLQRLKDKLGNHANASSEVEYDGAIAWLVGEEGRGVPTIIEMVNLTRLDCTLGSATSMRSGLTRAIHHAQHRKAFGAYLIDQPLMRNVLADLAVEAEAATMRRDADGGATDKAVRGDDARRCCGASVWRPASTGCASAPPRTPPRRWNASAATATSRSRECRGYTGKRH